MIENINKIYCKIIIIYIVFNFNSQAFCQPMRITEFKPTYAASYQYKLMRDTTKRNEYRTVELLVFFNNQESYCIGKDRFFNDSLRIDGYEKLLKENASQLETQMAKISRGMRSTSFNYLIRKDWPQKIITYSTEVSFSEMYYQEQIDAVKWQLIDSTATIQGFECKVAKKRYFGRNYTAYYAPSIPTQEGPLKFCGLPGLIIQIKDDLNEVDIILTELKPNTDIVQFYQNSNPIKTERKKLYDLVIQDYLDPFKTDEQLFKIKFREEDKIAFIKKRQEAMKTVNNRLEKE